MANKIQIKRGLQASLPTLSVGEPALTTNSGAEKVYIGTGTGNKEIPTLVGGVLPVVKGGTGSATLNSGTVGLGNVNNYGIATQAEAQAGTSDVKYMTPLKVKNEITALGGLMTQTGSYSGNEIAKTIATSFTPKIVIITMANGTTQNETYIIATGIRSTNHSSTGSHKHATGLSIVTNGFTVGVDLVNANTVGKTYDWLALK